jgi:hypothetical protein
LLFFFSNAGGTYAPDYAYHVTLRSDKSAVLGALRALDHYSTIRATRVIITRESGILQKKSPESARTAIAARSSRDFPLPASRAI